jgi:hypothetical protein
MSERQPDPEKVRNRNDDEPDVEGHILRNEPSERAAHRGEDEAPEDQADRVR